MPKLPRPLLTIACILGASALAPATAPGAAPHTTAGQAGVVLSAAHHGVRLVDRAHRVSKVHVRSARGLRRGQRVSIRNGRARVLGRVHRIAFLGRVVRSSARGTVLRLGDGSTFKLGKPSRHGHGARAASTITVDVQGLAPGQTVLITLSTDDRGNVAIAIKLLPATTEIGDGKGPDAGPVGGDGGGDPTQPGDDSSADGDEVDGVVTAIADDLSSITVDPGDGADASTITVDDPTLLDGVSVGDDVAVMTDADGIATEIDVLDFADDPGPGDDPGDGGGDA